MQLATKLPTWLVQTESDFERLIDEQLRRLETDRIDFDVFHALAADGWETVRRYRGLYALSEAGPMAGFDISASPSMVARPVYGDCCVWGRSVSGRAANAVSGRSDNTHSVNPRRAAPH